MSTASIPQQGAVVAAYSARAVRVNPFQRALGLIVLIPAVLGAGFVLAPVMMHGAGLAQLAWLSIGLSCFGAAFVLGLIRLVIGSITWQMRERASALR